MTITQRLLTKGLYLKVPGCHCHVITQKQFFCTLLRPTITGLGKTCIAPTLRPSVINAGRSTILSRTTVRSATTTTNKTRVLRKLFILARPQKWRLLGAITFLFVSSTVTMATPYFFGRVVDIINTRSKEQVKEDLRKIAALLLGMFIVGALCNFCRVYLINSSGYRITQALRKEAYAAILRQEIAFFDKHTTGELVGRIAGDAAMISSAVTTNVSDGLRSSISALTGISMMIYLSPQFALAGLAGLPIISAITIQIGSQFKKISRDIQNQLAELNKRAQERISNVRTVKAFGQENREIDRFDQDLQELLKIGLKECVRKGLFFGFAGFSGSTIILSVLYHGGVMVSESTMTFGELSAFLVYAGYLTISLRGLATFYSEFSKAVGANERLISLIEREPRISYGDLIPLQPLLGDIEFQNINFAYPTRPTVNVLNNFSLTIPKCTFTAVVGPSGSGKSTLAALLLRFYEPSTGQVLLDNYDLKSLEPAWVKAQIGVVPQDPILFSGTIRDNILYGVESATDEEMEAVIERAYVSEFVKKMPQGLDTEIGEKGITLSGGQRQRVAIARALIKSPKILILDEATSALDAKGEYYVQKALDEATVGRTVMIIAHRLSTIKNADKIVVLDRGRITETGTYSELISKPNGSFRKLVEHQTSSDSGFQC